MVQIKIKGIKDEYHVYASYDDENAFFVMLKERLELCRDHAHKFKAFFHVAMKCERDVCRLFALCEENNIQILGWNKEEKAVAYSVLEKSMRGGENYHFKENVVVLGNVHSHCLIESEANLYVMGDAHGTIDLFHENCVLCASSIHANVRICDSLFQNVTNYSPCKVYYEDRKIRIKKYKEESQWEKL